MRLYVSGHSPSECEKVAKILTEAGHEITSTWHTDAGPNLADMHEEVQAQEACNNVKAVRASTAVVMLAAPRRVPGGKFVEAGVAIGLNKEVFVLGHLENAMLRHPNVQRFDSAENLVRHLEDA